MIKTFNQICEDAKKEIQECTVDDVKKMKETNSNFVLVDVREDHEYEAGHIENAIHIGKGIIERDIDKKITDPNIEIILYCGGGSRSALAALSIQKMGYKNVKSMMGGWREWIKQNSK